MSEPKTIGFRMAKASTQDLDAAFALAGILDSLGRGYYPTGGKDQGEDAPTYFDRDDIDHLQHLHELLCGIEQRGSLFRVAGGLSTLLSDANGIVDPDDDCIALHPRIKDALAQRPATVDIQQFRPAVATHHLACRKRVHDCRSGRLPGANLPLYQRDLEEADRLLELLDSAQEGGQS